MNKLRIALLILMASIAGSTIHADDTDIYLKAQSLSSGVPLIMLTLDYRPNLGSSICNDASAASCATSLGDDLYLALSLDGDSVADYDGITIPAAWSGADVTLFDVMRTVFKVVLESQAGNDLRVGMMISHDNSCNGGTTAGPTVSDCSNGAYVLKGYFDPTDLIVNDARELANCGGAGCSNLDDLLYKLGKMTVPQGNVSHKFQGKEVYLELFKYLTGDGVFNGHLGWDDFGSSAIRGVSFNLDSARNQDGNGDPTTAFAWDSTIETAATASDPHGVYVSPYDDGGDWSCSKNFVINTMFQVSQQEDDSDDEIDNSPSSGGFGLTGNVTFPDVIQEVKNMDVADVNVGINIDGIQNITSYFISAQVNRTTNGYAQAGGTKTAIELDDPKQLLIDLASIFSEILSQSSIFVAASVPVSTFNRLEIADNVYFALFEADESPYWSGNVKKLKIVSKTNADSSISLEIEDVNGVAAFGADGRIKQEVLTHWTDASDANLDGDDPDGEANDNTDGRMVTRGGAGQRIPGYLNDSPGDSNSDSGARQMYTEATVGNSLISLNAVDTLANQLKPELGVVDADYANAATATIAARNMLRWLRGQDVNDEDADGDVDDVRPWIMGDPMHSRPLALNYGAKGAGYSESNPRINLIFGSNDGLLHIVENTDSSGNESGVELLSFAPRESLANVKTLMSGPTTPPHAYGVDGEPVALVIDNNSDGTIDVNDGDIAVVYFGMRRGGMSYYAFDVSDPSAVPALLWKIDNSSADYAELGLTFSTPQLAVVQYNDAPRAALVFAGGYSGGWNASNTARIGKDLNSDDDTTGNAVYIVNAKDGELIWKAKFGGSNGAQSNTEYHHKDLVDSIPSSVALFDSNNNNVDDRIYVGDSGGAVWRIDMPEGVSANHRKDNWFISKFAEFGTDGLATDRRFFHAPTVVRTKDDNGTYDGVAISSGNRADPKETDVTNYFFMLQDRNTLSGADAMRQDAGSPFVPLVVNDLKDITNCLTGDCNVAIPGWRLELEDNGEKGLSSSTVSNGQIFFTTFLPEGAAGAGTCAPSAGSGRLYIVSLVDGKPTMNLSGTIDQIVKQDRYTTATTTGIPSGVVDINGKYILTPTGEFIETDTDPRRKVYWREEGIDEL